MKINCFSITFWFNIFDNHNSIIDKFQEYFKDEYDNLNIRNNNSNLLNPIINAFNNEKMTNFSMSQINLQYNMDKVTMSDFDNFKNRSLEIYELLSQNNIETLHTAIYINSELIVDNALQKITQNTLNKQLISEDLIDTTLKFGKKEEDLFYKIVTLINKKQLKLPKKIDNQGRAVPLPLISWNGAFVENEIIEISFEINDKYSFDFTKNYHTTEFFLNKMLYLLETNYENDIMNLIENGEF